MDKVAVTVDKVDPSLEVELMYDRSWVHSYFAADIQEASSKISIWHISSNGRLTAGDGLCVSMY